MKFSVSVVLPAGGTGQRMNITKPKQFQPICGKPLIYYTLSVFSRIPWISKVYIAVPPLEIPKIEDLAENLHPEKFTIIPGGNTRHRSIHNGLKEAENGNSDVVIIHDAVRPDIDEDVLQQVANAAYQHGCAGMVCPLVSTVVSRTSDGFMDAALDRTQYVGTETPQAFRRDMITAAYSKCTDYDFDFGTECLHLAQKHMGSSVKLIQAPYHLWKVTHRKDLYAFEGLLQERRTVCLIPSEFCDFKLIQENLRAAEMKTLTVDLENISTVDNLDCVVISHSSCDTSEVIKSTERIKPHCNANAHILHVVHDPEDNVDVKLCRNALKSKSLRRKSDVQNGVKPGDDKQIEMSCNMVVVQSCSLTDEGVRLITELVTKKLSSVTAQIMFV